MKEEKEEEEEEEAITLNGVLHSLAINTSKKPEEPPTSTFHSTYNSPSLISPPSSAFVSALQSPYISPRLTAVNPPKVPENPSQSPPISGCSSRRISEFVPSSSGTPPPERSDFSTTDYDEKHRASEPRISFSFPIVPRVSFANARASFASTGSVNGGNAKLRSCDVFIGCHGHTSSNLLRVAKWLKSELEVRGIACFMADRAKYADTQSHEIADRVICSATYGIVVVSDVSLSNRFNLEEIGFFGRKKNLVPVLVDVGADEIMDRFGSLDDKETREAIDALLKSHALFKLEANSGEWRSCIANASDLLTSKLGRKSTVDEIASEELPFPRNRCFVGREKEILEMEVALFGSEDSCEMVVKGCSSGQSEGFADEETDNVGVLRREERRFISLEMGRSLGSSSTSTTSNSETWSVETGRSSLKRPKYKKSRSLICVNGAPGVGKTELALEFAYRHSQRYKMVLWLGGEVRYMRQNILNLAVSLGLDLSADLEKERGRIRSFDEQENEAFKRVKRELFKDVPYLIIIDNLENESEWWEGKDLHDLIPRNTGGSHVIVTTRINRVMNADPTLQVQAFPFADAVALIRGRRKKEFQSEELDFLKKMNERLGGSAFGLWIVASLLSELLVSPSTLYEAVDQVPLEDASNPFIIKLMWFCFDVLEKTSKRKNCLASKMLLVGSWLAPAPISATILASAVESATSDTNRLKGWTQCLNQTMFCSSGCYLTNPSRKSHENSALMLSKLGLARNCSRKPGSWIQFHPLTTQVFKRREGFAFARAAALSIRKSGNPLLNSDHLWASAYLIFGLKSEPPTIQLNAADTVTFIKKTALPLAIWAFTTFSRCNSALELLKVCTSVLEEVEKSFVSQVREYWHGSLCWRKKVARPDQKMDEYVWRDVTLLKATLLETRAKLLLRGGHFDSAEELCRVCTSIRTVMLGHNHAQTLAAQQTLAKLVRSRSKIV